jgi:protein-S-isoprenylcysteine O-methyltransferase Ste14
MFVLYLGFIGLTAFTLGVWALGSWLRKHPSRTNAEKSGRVLHVLFSAGLVVPGAMMIVLYLNFIEVDTLVGMKPLPVQPFFRIVGLILAVPGLYLIGVSNKSLRSLGNGLDAFRLTKKIVRKNIYTYTRNPMSLGYYLWTLGLGLVSGSSFVTGVILFGFIPAHLFFLKYFEELELELRFGETYRGYKRDVPFLIPEL